MGVLSKKAFTRGVRTAGNEKRKPGVGVCNPLNLSIPPMNNGRRTLYTNISPFHSTRRSPQPHHSEL